MNLDISNYFTNPTGVCTYTQCSIVDINENAISWLTGANFSGNICSFNVDISNIQAQTNFYIKLISTTASPLTIISNAITI
jgi:hypothetical protein